MAETTGILWTDSTHNEWWGCQVISPACDRCYAATLDRRTGGNYWEDGVMPRRTGVSNRNKPLRYNRLAIEAGRRHKMFCGSMMDWADNRVPTEWRDDMWKMVARTPMVDWQLLTKRAPNIRKMLPADWGDGYDNVWLGCTVEDRKHGLPRIEHLRRVPAKVRFLSCEPLLEDLGAVDLTGIHWVIIGGESEPGGSPRPMQMEWVESLIRQCRAQGVAVFFKQWGGRTRDKGGCEYEGREIKEFPRPEFPLAA